MDKTTEQDKSDWLRRVMASHPGIADLRERVSPLNRAIAFGHIYGVGQGAKMRKDVVVRLLLQHLEYEGYTATRRMIEEEAGVRYVDTGIPDSRLLEIMRRSTRASERVWQLCLDPPSNLAAAIAAAGAGASAEDVAKAAAAVTPAAADAAREEDLFVHLSQNLGIVNEGDDLLELDVDVWQEMEDKPSNIIFNEAPADIRAASINKLIERLTPMGDSDLPFMQVFLLTYQSFMSPEVFLIKLVTRYRVPKHVADKIGTEGELKIKMRVVNVMKNWIDDHFNHFDDKLIRGVRLFIDDLTENNDQHLAKLLHAALAKKEVPRKRQTDLMFNKEPPAPIVPKNIFSLDLDPLRHVEAEEIARHLTLIEYAMFRDVQPSELLNLAWSKAKYKHRARNVLNLIARFNTISSWVSSEIVKPEKCRDRVKVLTKFIVIAEHCRNLNNFSTVQAILSGLSNAGVHRLHHTFDDLNAKHVHVMEDLRACMSNANNHKPYRETLRLAAPPKVPYLGVYLTDLTFIEDGNPDVLKTEEKTVLVNFSKRRKIAQVIQEIQRNQMTPYNLLGVDQLLRRLVVLPAPLVEEEIYNTSLQREPRGALREEIL